MPLKWNYLNAFPARSNNAAGENTTRRQKIVPQVISLRGGKN